MGKRSTARKLAMQILYQYAIQKDNMDYIIDTTMERESYIEQTKDLAVVIVNDVIKYRDKINKLIEKYTIDWKFSRMAAIDIAILQVGVWEILFSKNTINVIVAEAIELINKFSQPEAIKFINGILGKISENKEQCLQELSKP